VPGLKLLVAHGRCGKGSWKSAHGGLSTPVRPMSCSAHDHRERTGIFPVNDPGEMPTKFGWRSCINWWAGGPQRAWQATLGSSIPADAALE